MSHSSRPPRHPADILVVDDSVDLREAIAETLAMNGHNVESASNGAVAIECALAHRPDIVVFDYAMPVTDGPALVEQLRTLIHPTPILVGISGSAQSRVWCADHGVPIFLMKPFEEATLRRAIDAAIDAMLEARAPKLQVVSSRPAARRANPCVIAVGVPSRDASLRDALPPASRGARMVVVDSAAEAERILDLIVPDLLIVDDVPEHDELRARADVRGIPIVIRGAPENTHVATMDRQVSGTFGVGASATHRGTG